MQTDSRERERVLMWSVRIWVSTGCQNFLWSCRQKLLYNSAVSQSFVWTKLQTGVPVNTDTGRSASYMLVSSMKHLYPHCEAVYPRLYHASLRTACQFTLRHASWVIPCNQISLTCSICKRDVHYWGLWTWIFFTQRKKINVQEGPEK